MAKNRTPKGEGTVFQRKDGFWYTQHSYQTESGKRKRISKSLGRHPNKASALAEAKKRKLTAIDTNTLIKEREKQAAPIGA